MNEPKVKSKHVPSDIANNYDYRMRFLNSALLLAESSGKTIRDAFYKMKNVTEKDGQADLVTETDKAVEQHIFATLKAEYPSHCFIGEESVSDGASSKLTSTPTWIVDPIDGTTNFVHMFPYVAVSIGLVIEKKVELGVVYAPILDDWYIALRGYGAFLNGKRLRIHNPPSALDKALVAFEWGANRDKKIVNTKAKNLMDTLLNHKVHGVRCMGSAALDMCLVGRGSVDLYFEWGPHCWDFAAASLVVEESGGVCTTTAGKPFDLMSCMIIAASSRALIEELVPSLTQIVVKRDDE